MAVKLLPDLDYLRQCFAVDRVTGVLTWRVRPLSHFVNSRVCNSWNVKYSGKIAGSEMADGKIKYLGVSLAPAWFFAHRIVWKMTRESEPPPLVDHRNGKGLDNSPDNLRDSTKAQNSMNQRKRASQSDKKGITKVGNRWKAQIMAFGVWYNVGRFDSAEQAHAAYCEAATRLHGEFANFGEDRQRTSP